MDKENVAYIQWNIIQPFLKKETLQLVTTYMGLEDIMLSEVSQTEKDKYYMISLICGIYKSQTHRVPVQDGNVGRS